MLLTSIPRKLARKGKLNRNRRLRRKRNKKFFLLKLKAKRAARSEDSLCESIADLFDIGGDQTMDINNIHSHTAGAASGTFAQSMQEVADWQHQHQLAHWKSRALALQMENQMLHKHIKRLYDKQMQQYLTYKDAEWKQVAPKEETTKRHSVKQTAKPDINGGNVKLGNDKVETDEMALPPSEQPGEARRKKLLEMYGDKAAKINGMETSIQLNFEYCMNKDNPPYWPNIPLKM